MYGCQQVCINDSTLKPYLEFVCSEANKLINCGIYYARQLYFKTGKIISKLDLNYECKPNIHFKFMHSQASQQSLMSVAESFVSYKGLLAAYNAGKLADRPKLPNYRTKRGLAVVSYPKQALKLKDGLIRIPLGKKVKACFGIDSFSLKMPSNLAFSDIKELRILPRNQCFYAEFVYELETQATKLDVSRVLGIDPGLNNWLTCISNIGTSFIVDGLHIKSLNRWYNKQISTLNLGKPQGFWSKRLASITEKCNRQVRDAINKAARLVINYCIENKIGQVVFGWNKRQKQEIRLGAKTNQKFVQIPTARLKERIAQLCEQYGIRFVETEESYTSQASFLDDDFLPTYGERPDSWKSSGKRVKRGLFRTAHNCYINADCNGAANILKKVATKLGFDLSRVGRASLTAPQRVFLWSAKQKRSNVVLTRCGVSV
ncbi:RNA-guided endonuclease InsQ/TnpB family protein [Gloeocapsopsis dulcis]|uniref:Transposase n=1 Tax=Gloeocapsopsis dulcis AAB1 = 1H9 TaxID=1433147 RepID=A0A6N8FQX1_9CHRO|nr:RNA-guided endonuclease TnpB family protein [Gloeocapsopsis dulcis]MUL35560.1 transposase [Gloeocapsopsis dulcis AAB1 = 1H9]WNN87536.1 transposase [Gloeocapsopsis dulcis]